MQGITRNPLSDKDANYIEMERVVQHGVFKPQLPDAGVDGVQPQIIDDHIGGNVVRTDDHHGSGVTHLQLCAHAQRPQHATAVHELALFIRDFFVKVRFAPLHLQVQHSQNKRLDGGSRFKFLVRADLHSVSLQVVHKDAHLALIAVQLGGNSLFQRHVFIHIGNFSVIITDFPQKSAWRCGNRRLPPRPR